MCCRLPEDKEWKIHQRVLLLDTADNLYSAAIQQENFVDPFAIVISGFKTQSYKPAVTELTLRSVCSGVKKVKHRIDKYHSTMRVWFSTADLCTRAITILKDVVDRGKLSRLCDDADAGSFEIRCPKNGFHVGDQVILTKTPDETAEGEPLVISEFKTGVSVLHIS